MTTRLLCFAPFGGRYAVHHQLDIALALGVRIKGDEALILGCRGTYHSCEAILFESPANVPSACAMCAHEGRALLSLGSTPYMTIDQMFSPEEAEEATVWSKQQSPTEYAHTSFEGRPLGRWALSSLLTAFQISTSELHRPDIVPFYQALLRNAVLTAKAVERVIQQYKPTVACVFNARFNQYRAAFEVLRAAGIRVLVHERGFADNTFLFYDNRMINDSKALLEIVNPWQSVPLSTDEAERVRQYVQGRESGRDFNAPAFMRYTSDEKAIRHRLEVGSRRLIGFFSSTETELAQAEGVTLANLQIPLLRKLLDFCRRNPEETLVIRHHPNLAGDANHAPEYALLSQCYELLADAPPNVRCIMPSEQLSTYALMWHLDVGIAPVSSVGLELPSRGVPSMTVAGTTYTLAQAASFDDPETLDLDSTIASLKSRQEHFGPDDLRPCYRLLYSYIARASVSFRSLQIKNFYQADINRELIADLAEDRDPNLSRILSGLRTQQSIFPVPDPVQATQSDAEETAFLQRQVDAIKAKRSAIFQESTKPAPELPPVTLIELSPRTNRYPTTFQSRYKHLQFMQIPLGSSIKESLLAIARGLTHCSSQLVAVAHPDVSFDGNFIRDGVEGLAENLGQYAAIVRGMWLADNRGILFSEIVGARSGIPSTENLRSVYGGAITPLHLLSLGLYEVSYLRQLLEGLATMTDESAMIDSIIKEWSLERVNLKQRQAGLIVLNSNHPIS